MPHGTRSAHELLHALVHWGSGNDIAVQPVPALLGRCCIASATVNLRRTPRPTSQDVAYLGLLTVIPLRRAATQITNTMRRNTTADG